MANIYVMDSSKTLKCTQMSKNYIGENSAETIFILLPQIYNGHNIKECLVAINFIDNPDNFFSKKLNYNDELYKNYLVYQLPIDKTLSKEIGVKHFYVTIKNVNFSITTNNCSLEILGK